MRKGGPVRLIKNKQVGVFDPATESLQGITLEVVEKEIGDSYPAGQRGQLREKIPTLPFHLRREIAGRGSEIKGRDR